MGKSALFFPDMHATDKGCEIMARVVLRELVAAGLCEVDSIPNPLEVLEGWTPPKLEAEVEEGPEGGRPEFVSVRYGTGFGAVLLVSTAKGSTLIGFPDRGSVARTTADDRHAKELPLATDALLYATLKDNQFATESVDSNGEARLRIPWEIIDGLAPDQGEVWGSVLVLLPKVGPVVDVSEPIRLSR